MERRKAKQGVRVYPDAAGSTYDIPLKTRGPAAAAGMPPAP
ncbi:hypothetical protein [Streptomyces sannanensis]